MLVFKYLVARSGLIFKLFLPLSFDLFYCNGHISWLYITEFFNTSFGPSTFYTLTTVVIGDRSIIVVDCIFKVLRIFSG